MEFLNFETDPLWVVGVIFVAAAGAVWFAGTRLSRYASVIAERTGVGQAFVGLLLLGGITSLPEVATSVTASLGGNAALAVNNLLGGVAMQVAILAIADAAIGRDALTSVIVQPVILLQGALNVMLLVLVLGGITVGEVAFLGVGVWVGGILVLYLLSVWLIAKYQSREGWIANHTPRHADGGDWQRKGDDERNGGSGRSESPSLRTAVLKTAAAGLVILMAGFLLARTGEAIAVKTGLGSSFVGAVFVAVSTSLPEVSTVLSAVRLRKYGMAVSDIFGTNLFDIVLVFLVDAVYAGGPVLGEVGRFSSFGALLGIAVTTLYLAGLIERRDRTFLRMGIDSIAVLVVYLGGIAILYSLR